MHPLHGIQGAGFNAIPASHAHIMEYKRRLKGTVYLFHNLMGAGLRGCAEALAWAAISRITQVIIH